MKYIVKIIATATEQNKNFADSVNTYFVGKGGYIKDDVKWCEGWSRKHFAEHYIKDDKEWKDQYNKNHHMFWIYDYEIIEI